MIWISVVIQLDFDCIALWVCYRQWLWSWRWTRTGRGFWSARQWPVPKPWQTRANTLKKPWKPPKMSVLFKINKGKKDILVLLFVAERVLHTSLLLKGNDSWGQVPREASFPQLLEVKSIQLWLVPQSVVSMKKGLCTKCVQPQLGRTCVTCSPFRDYDVPCVDSWLLWSFLRQMHHSSAWVLADSTS